MRDPEPAAASSRPGDAGAPWRQPVRGGHPDPILAAAPGLEFLRAMLTGETPASPLSRLTGMHPVELTAELVRFALPLSRWLCGEDGTVPLGVLAIPADAAMACAIIAELPAGSAITTSELGIRQVRPVRPGGMLLCTGTVLDLGPPVALAEVTITDDSGALVARGGSLCVVLPFTAEGGPAAGRTEQSPEPADPDPDPDPDRDPDPDPDPWERSVPDAGLSRLTGLTMIAVAPGEAAFALPATRWLCAPPPGRVQGGAVAMLAGAAMDAAMQSAAAPGSRFVPLELKLNYLRPLASDGREAAAHATLIHGGRRTAVARAEVTDADGRAIAMASGSAIAERAGP